MKKGAIRFVLLLASLVLAALASTLPCEAQLAVGGQLSRTRFGRLERSWGEGVRVTFGIPLTGVSIQGTLDAFDPPCADGRCAKRAGSVSLLWSPPALLGLDPYLGIGVAMQSDGGLDWVWTGARWGLNGVVGLVAGRLFTPRLRPFGEWRYELRDGQSFLSLGVLFFLL